MKKWFALGMMFAALQSASAVTPSPTDTPEALLLEMTLCMGPAGYTDPESQIYWNAHNKLFDKKTDNATREFRLLGAKAVQHGLMLGEIPGYYVRLQGQPEEILLNLHREQGIDLKLDPKSDRPACQPEQKRCTRIWTAEPRPSSTPFGKYHPVITLAEFRDPQEKTTILFGCALTTMSMLP